MQFGARRRPDPSIELATSGSADPVSDDSFRASPQLVPVIASATRRSRKVIASVGGRETLAEAVEYEIRAAASPRRRAGSGSSPLNWKRSGRQLR